MLDVKRIPIGALLGLIFTALLSKPVFRCAASPAGPVTTVTSGCETRSPASASLTQDTMTAEGFRVWVARKCLTVVATTDGLPRVANMTAMRVVAGAGGP